MSGGCGLNYFTKLGPTPHLIGLVCIQTVESQRLVGLMHTVKDAYIVYTAMCIHYTPFLICLKSTYEYYMNFRFDYIGNNQRP